MALLCCDLSERTSHHPNPQPNHSANAQQAAAKQAEILNDPQCPFQHDTCSKYVRYWLAYDADAFLLTSTDSNLQIQRRYCNLYDGKCGWDARISRYEPNWTGLGENIAMTTDTAARDPIAAVVRATYLLKHMCERQTPAA
jgi:hypothetical protein